MRSPSEAEIALDRDAVANELAMLRVMGDEPDLLLRYRRAFPGHFGQLDTWYLIPALGEDQWWQLVAVAIERGRPIDQADLDIPIDNPATTDPDVLS